jgi:hypothetical protein
VQSSSISFLSNSRSCCEPYQIFQSILRLTASRWLARLSRHSGSGSYFHSEPWNWCATTNYVARVRFKIVITQSLTFSLPTFSLWIFNNQFCDIKIYESCRKVRNINIQFRKIVIRLLSVSASESDLKINRVRKDIVIQRFSYLESVMKLILNIGNFRSTVEIINNYGRFDI